MIDSRHKDEAIEVQQSGTILKYVTNMDDLEERSEIKNHTLG
jgi:hypothetical protein